MTHRMHSVAVKQLPEIVNAGHESQFFRELESCMNVDRPRIVLDCSGVRQMDRFALHLLLCCLEEAMKRNGDVKLAAVSEEARAVFGLTGIDRLFEIFPTSTEAAKSFRQHSLDFAGSGSVPHDKEQPSGNAA
jgi:anti-sigma B factor antagonist